MGKIAVVGSLNMDLVVKSKTMPKIGETVIGSALNQIPGGKGANQAVAIARLGGEVSMIGKTGIDAYADALLDSMNRDGVKTETVGRAADCSTGVALIIVDANANNSIVVVPGANFEVSPAFIDEKIDEIQDAEIVVTQLEIPLETVRYALEKSKALGKFTVLNPAPAQPLEDEIIKNVDLLMPNETELEILAGMKIESEEDVLAASKEMIGRGVKTLIVTLGEKGCVYVTEDTFKRYGAYSADAVDTTAAGDSFIGAIAISLANNESIDSAIDFASKVGALTVTKEGAQSSLPYLDEVLNFQGVKR